MRGFETSDKDLRVEAALNLGGIGAFQKEFDGLLQIRGGFFDRLALAGHIQLRAECDLALPFFLDDRGIATHGHEAPP